ncbi:hypothetical protein B9G69_008590 [Bdellovibrio sp. SKB1291214]|uniref:hypothetical protein n=1 Tax=Bdellovibrio sp. SKB1291214 TaxID=1732569 RepID=UPI001594F053|nr:hypothetical protein [Bdellovibrio sp. SKB1291214]UYL10631.1 hypothetical protein B9G69_008590 [Bdellovibrio sp. SKB1291214]
MTVFKDVKQTYKDGGFKGLRKKYGWKMFAVIISYYLVRDITLYVLIPYFVIRSF